MIVGQDLNTPRPGTLHERVREVALRQPTAVAVVCEGVELCYAELDRRANQIAHKLQQMGAGKDSLVAIAMDRSVDMVVGLFGILKSGAAYLPLDLSYPQSRLDFLLSDAAPIAVLTRSVNLESLPGIKVPLLAIDDSALEAEPTHSPGNSAATDSLAYVIYTSGSTGQPKGCQVSHGNVVRLFDSTQHWFGFGPNDVWTFFHSHAFDFSVWEIWGALISGGRVVVVPYLTSRSPRDFHELLVQQRVTVLNQTPSAFRALIDADRSSGLAVDALSLRYVIFGGEALALDMLQPWFDRHGDQRPLLVNMYGITETTVHVTYRPIRLADLRAGKGSVIGVPIPDLQIWLLDTALRPVATGEIGEMYVSGAGVCRGYLNRPELSAERFFDWTPPGGGAPVIVYKTGDLARYGADGELTYLGRSDHQVKIKGFRIETGEIESQLAGHPGVRASAVIARQDGPGGEPRLVAYIVPGDGGVHHHELRSHLLERLPEYMVPSVFVDIAALPLTGNGKLDRGALPSPASVRPDISEPYLAPSTDTERLVCAAFAQHLELDQVGVRDNFFELGGGSLLAVHMLEALIRATGRDIGVAAIFAHPTPAGLARLLDERGGGSPEPLRAVGNQRDTAFVHEPIAVIGMAGRFPGASTIEAFWSNLLGGRDTITRFTPDTLDPSVPASLRNDPDYVWARGIIDGVEDFDAAFFAIPAREAEVTDPQQRVFLELAWECLERAGYAPDRTVGTVGVFAGAGTPSYLLNNVLKHKEAIERVGELQVQLGNDKDYIATRVAYRLNLKGPAVNVNTACSTSLVAVAQAVDSLRMGRCQMALAGAASITSPPRSGYLAQDGSMLSADGHTRTFDKRAQGTAFNDGATVVLLKRLSDAIADGDQVYAVVKGIGINNDGGGKASFTAPSVDGQAAAIEAAHLDAGVRPRDISYVEAHGTATPLGDPVEIEALTRAFRRGTEDKGFCGIGSVKSNVGHLVAAAGVAGLIKTALALHAEKLPATIHFESPNPKIDFNNTPFAVAARAAKWPRSPRPRLAGVSSFGVGGTNAHVVLEEAPLLGASDPAVGPQLLLLSAKTQAALDAMAHELASHLTADPTINLADVAHTLTVGRSRFAYRLCAVGETPAQSAEALVSADDARRSTRVLGSEVLPLIWMFPGQGSQYSGMGSGAYASDEAFRDAFDASLSAMSQTLDFDLKARMFDADGAALINTATAQPAIFSLEYALARAWQARGLRATALIGHSVGEFVAAVLAGVMSLADAARLVASRGALLQSLPSGNMLAVRLPRDEVLKRLPPELSLAAENGPTTCVVAGPTGAVEDWRAAIDRDGIVARVLQTSHAFHSSMMDPAVSPFRDLVRQVTLSTPRVPIVSTLTGTWMTDADATDPNYWARHLREPVLFSSAVRTAQARYNAVYLEVGPRGSLSTLARQHLIGGKPPIAIQSLTDNSQAEAAQWRLALGQLWTLGHEPVQAAVASPRGRSRVRLPTYPFQRKRLWLDAPPAGSVDRTSNESSPLSSTAPGSIVMQSDSASVNVVSRRSQFGAQLRELFGDVTGSDFAAANGTDSFLELGLDSLSLTQAALQVKKHFKVSLTFRQLMEKYKSFDTLTEFLASSLPPDPVVAAVAPQSAPSAPATQVPVGAVAIAPTVADGNENFMQRVIQQQMALMAQQLAVLGGAAVPAAPSLPPTVSSATSIPVPAATPPTTEVASAEGVVRYDVKKAFGAIARIHTQKNEITDRQRARLGAFMRRYNERTQRSRLSTEQNRGRLADPRVVNGFRPMTKEITYQIVVNRSKGSRVWDLDGNEYIDVLNGFGMNMFGWQPDFVQDAVRQQLEAGYEIGPQHPLAGEVAQLVCDITGFDRAGLCNTGSEAVMAAIRIARTVTGRSTIVAFTGSYHGVFDEVLVRGGRGGKGIPAAPGIMPGMFGDIRVLEYGTPESLEFIRANADDLAAVLVEPVQSRRPEFQPREFLQEVRAITERSGTCFIFDEVITGFRTHLGGVQALFGIRADLACYGKVIGGGFPVGVVAGKRDYMDSLDGGSWQYGDDSMPTVGVTYFAGTFVRHPLALAAAKASLLHLKNAGNDLQTQLNARTADLVAALNRYCKEAGAPLEIRYFASLWRVSWHEDHPLQDLLFAMMRSRGVHILDNFPCFMTTAHTLEDIAAIKTAFRDSLSELQESEFLPRRVDAAVVVDATRPPVPNAKLGRDKDGTPAWFVPDANAPGKYAKLSTVES